MIQTLELTHFRSYASGLFAFEPGVNIVVGPNASGKTNLLQALHTIATGSGFSVYEKDMIAMGSEWSRLEAMTDRGVRVVKLQQEKPKILEIDGQAKKRITAQHTLPVIVFEPEHMLMLGSEPERRRAYLDNILSFTHAGYKSELLAYKRALSQRNRLLKQPGTTAQSLFVWDVQLSQRAGLLAGLRYELVQQLNSVCQDIYRSISSTDSTVQLSYNSKLSHKNYADHMLAHLRDHVDVDLQRGFTTVGPHRDDLYIELNASDARLTASRGETRSIILSLKIAELRLLHEQTGVSPLLLLDDVFGELDGTRRRSLAEALQGYQTFLTTTDADVVVEHFTKTCNIIPMS